MSPIEMLDKCLEWFALDIAEFVKTDSQIANEKISKPAAITEIGRCYEEINGMDFLMYAELIIDKLVRDGYLKKDGDLLSITFEGKLFSKTGGYSRQLTENETKATTLADQSQRMERNEERLVSWTKYLTFGTIAIVVWEMVKTFCLGK
jgi:hypothetical protein